MLLKEADGATGLGIAFHRLWIGALGLTIVYLARGGRITWSFLRSCLPGGAAFALDITLFFSAVRETTVTNATIIGALQPVLVMALAPRLFGEELRWSDLALGAVAIGGCVLTVSGAGGGDASAYGDLLAVGALGAWTWYFVASKRARRGLTSFEYLTGLSIVAVGLMLPIAVVARSQLGAPTAKGWTIIAVLALVNGAVGHMLMNWAHGHVPIVITSLLTLAIPVVAAVSAWLIIGEHVTALQWIGMGIVVVSLAIVVLHQHHAAARRELQPLAS